MSLVGRCRLRPPARPSLAGAPEPIHHANPMSARHCLVFSPDMSSEARDLARPSAATFLASFGIRWVAMTPRKPAFAATAHQVWRRARVCAPRPKPRRRLPVRGVAPHPPPASGTGQSVLLLCTAPGARFAVLCVGLTSARGLSVAKSLSSLSNPLSGWRWLVRVYSQRK
jgi:hypothetical protein